MISIQKVKNRLAAASISYIEVEPGLIAVAPSSATALRTAFADQAHYLAWLDRDYRVSAAYFSGTVRGHRLHKGPLATYPFMTTDFASVEVQGRIPDTDLTSRLSVGFTASAAYAGLVSAEYAGRTGQVNGLTSRSWEAAPTAPQTTWYRRTMCGLPFSGTYSFVASLMLLDGYSPSYYGRGSFVTDSGGSACRPYVRRDTGAYALREDGSGRSTNGMVVFEPIADLHNWLLVTGPTALTVGELFPGGFAWIWATNAEVANVLELSVATRQGAEKLNLEREVAKLRATEGGLGVIRGVASLNPYVMHWQTAQHATALWALSENQEGMNIVGLKTDWLSGSWLPVMARSVVTLEALTELYSGTGWVVNFTADGLYRFTRTTSDVVELAEGPAKVFARELAWAGGVLLRGNDELALGRESGTESVMTAFTDAGPYQAPAAFTDPTPDDPRPTVIGQSAVAQLLSFERPADHPAVALCNPFFTAAY